MPLHVLGLAAPGFAVVHDAFSIWPLALRLRRPCGRDVLFAGPLLIPQFSHVGIDLGGNQDTFMAAKKPDYFEYSHVPLRSSVSTPSATRAPIYTMAWHTPEAYAALMKLVPYTRIGELEAIGCAAAWLASDWSDYVVGTSLFVDGGMTLFPGFSSGG